MDAVTGTAGNDTINSNVASFGALDVIAGGAGTDTLNVVDTGTAFTGFGGATISGIETVNINTGGAVGSIASAAGTTTAAVAQRASFSLATNNASSAATVAANQKYNVTIGGVIYETVALDSTPTLAEANAAIRAVLTTVLGDQATVAAGTDDSVTSSSGVTTDTTRLTVTSNVAGKALPSISIANQSGGRTSIGSISTTADLNPSVSNVVGTGPLAVKEVIAISVSDNDGTTTTGTTDPSASDTVDVYIGGVKYSSALSPDSAGNYTYSAVATQIATIINSVLGAGTAVAGGTSVTVTAPTAGTPLPVITTSMGGATDYRDTYSVLTSNIAANAVASSASLVAAPTGTTAYSVTASGVAAVSAATTSTITVSGTAVQTSGGSDVTVTASNSVRVSGAKGAVSITTGSTATTLVGAVAADTATGTAGDAAGIYVTGGTTVSITANYLAGNVKVGTAPYAVSSVNTTGGLPQLNGSISLDPTGDVSITRGTSSTSSSTGLVSRFWSEGTAKVYMNGGTTATVRGAGATDIVDVGTLSLQNASGVATIGTSKLATVNLSGLSGTANITSDAISTVSVSDSLSAQTINIRNSGATGANTGTINYVLSNVGTDDTTRVTLSNSTATAINLSSGAASAYTGSRNTNSESFVTLTSANATAISLANSLPVNLGDVLATAAKVGTISGGSASGAISLTLGATPTQGMALTTGSGNDVVTIKTGVDLSANGTTAATTTVNLGAGNDSLLNATAVIHGTTGASFNGGDGTDTVAISLLNAGNVGRFTNFEVLGLDLNTTDTRDTTIMSGITGLALLRNAAGVTVTYTGVKAAQGLTVASNLSDTGVTALSFESAVTSGTSDSYTVTFAGTGTTSSTATKTAINAGVLSLAGIETVNIASGSATGFTNNTLALRDASATSLVITGAQYATVTFNTAFGTAATSTNGLGVTTVDASGTTGGVSLTFDDATVFETAFSSFVVRGGTGNDTITVSAALDATSVTVDGGTGDDTLVSPLGKSITLTGGAGKDTFNVGATVYGAGGYATIITDAAAGDSLRLANKGVETFVSTKFDVGAATSLASALGLALSDTTGGTNGVIKWFQYGGNTYVVQCMTNNATVTDAATTDLVIRLNGVVDLSTATLSGTAGAPTLTFG